MTHKLMKGEIRTIEQLRKDYEIEKELANRLRHASKEERRFLYSSLYDELYQRTPLHPQVIQKSSPQLIAQRVRQQIKFIEPYLNKETTFLETGPGDCALSIAIARRVKQVFAVDVSNVITEKLKFPDNVKLVICDGSSIPVAENSISVAYSNQLMEHLHPDDALEQLKNIYKSLAPGGVYICITPNRLNGPHDVSRYFDQVATGFHLKEYTTTELVGLFQTVGFTRCDSYIGKGIYIKVPLFIVRWFESFLSKLPFGVMKVIARSPLRVLLGIKLVGRK